jgi:hypothetical protein
MLERRTIWNQNLCAGSVRPQDDLALTQGSKSDTLRLEHRLFRNPVTEKSWRTLLLSQFHDRGLFGRSKVSFGKFGNFDVRTNSFKVNSNLLPL